MSAAAAVDGGRALQVLTTVRAATLLFSVPYLWTWTAGLSAGVRWSAVGVHAAALLAANCWNNAVDAARGLAPHIGLVRDPDAVDGDLAGRLAWVFAGAAVVASLGLVPVSIAAPPAVAVLLAAVWFAARAPTVRKYLGAPEIAAPALVIVVPAVALRLFTDAAPAWSTVVAGAAFLSALILATHIRDRGADLRDRVPTVATRNLPAARGWLLLTAAAGVFAAVAPLDTPLSTTEWLRGATALTFGAATVVRERRVAILTAAHGLFALTLFL